MKEFNANVIEGEIISNLLDLNTLLELDISDTVITDQDWMGSCLENENQKILKFHFNNSATKEFLQFLPSIIANNNHLQSLQCYSNSYEYGVWDEKDTEDLFLSLKHNYLLHDFQFGIKYHQEQIPYFYVRTNTVENPNFGGWKRTNYNDTKQLLDSNHLVAKVLERNKSYFYFQILYLALLDPSSPFHYLTYDLLLNEIFANNLFLLKNQNA
jgi:hypothetical protein